MSSGVFGFARAIEKFGIERYKKNSIRVCLWIMHNSYFSNYNTSRVSLLSDSSFTLKKG